MAWTVSWATAICRGKEQEGLCIEAKQFGLKSWQIPCCFRNNQMGNKTRWFINALDFGDTYFWVNMLKDIRSYSKCKFHYLKGNATFLTVLLAAASVFQSPWASETQYILKMYMHSMCQRTWSPKDFTWFSYIFLKCNKTHQSRKGNSLTDSLKWKVHS